MAEQDVSAGGVTFESLARKVYPGLASVNEDGNEEAFYGPSDYTPIVASQGDIVSLYQQETYQGDTIAVVYKGGLYGFIRFGWGSCSGCDALQACESYKALGELIEQMQNTTRWYASVGELMDWVKAHDWEVDHTYLDDKAYNANMLAEWLAALPQVLAHYSAQREVESFIGVE
jgi:hypothetical protein